MQISAKFRENLNQQFKIIQWCQSKAHMQLPISH